MKRVQRPTIPPTTCLMTGKVGYGRRCLARRAARSLQARDGAPVSSYLCEHCGRWHIGHAQRRRP